MVKIVTETPKKTVDYTKIHNSMSEMMSQFKLLHDKAKAENTITYRKI
ncbi:hypothetical protein ACQ31_gp119 [Salmonella phage STML-198]|uniref:Uncharacterized protein n=3 Tax=Gelderlandvirus TaxID=1913653 RepID=K4I404_9CAUD|nr:hypothetical protein STP4a_051 [Salmonella phage STP4-a]YP_009148044.1 hypothetical protein ACQ31_gp119 [Salmonella phage STML-198]YP_009615536.1 hypothetical protein FDI73_gp050 [Salmonella phage Melville]AFU64002.1 hypothetical protein [Salmonella phage STML-198]AHJ86906.1 hypothetical protein STP4a_051 [Salmonella phage STP4-a]ATN93024.1 hypothetical protein CPT_Melville_050 [Salmonella phage Melville]